MKTNTNKGFTLIELIMVIVILGILAAVAVPKFFDVTAQAHYKNQKAVLGNIKAGLNLYAANELVANGSRAFPDGDVLEAGTKLAQILDEVPENWDIGTVTADDDIALIVYSGGATDTTYTYTSTGGSSYTLSAGVGS